MTEQPEPDTKDWTWVLGERCPDCGFDTRVPERAELAPLTRELARRWDTVLRTSEDPARRPAPTVWSPLEYACHLRDAFALASARVELMLVEDAPRFANWDQDEAALAGDYASQDAEQVRLDLVRETERFADVVAQVPDEGWSRTGLRGDGAAFTVESFTRYLLHDPVHHLTDVTGEPWH